VKNLKGSDRNRLQGNEQAVQQVLELVAQDQPIVHSVSPLGRKLYRYKGEVCLAISAGYADVR